MKKFLKLALFSAICSSSAYSLLPSLPSLPTDTSAINQLGSITGISPGEATKYNVNPLNIFKSLQYDLLWDVFEIDGWGTCPSGSFWPDFGIDVTIIEPKGLIETTQKKYYSPALDISFGSATDYLSLGASRTSKEEDDSTKGGRDNMMYSHYWKFNVFGMIFSNSLFCFDGGMPFTAFWFSEWTPGYTQDYTYTALQPMKAAMMTATGMITQIVDCAASMGVDTIEGFATAGVSSAFEDTKIGLPNLGITGGGSGGFDALLGQAESYLNSVRNIMDWDTGCLGFAAVGGYSAGEDPAEDTIVVSTGLVDILAKYSIPYTFFYKQTEISGMPSSMCYPYRFPGILKSQYVYQSAGIPSVGKGHVIGVSAISSSLANTPATLDEWVNWVWGYRDYRAFAYDCPYF